MMTSLRMIEKVNRINTTDVTYGLMEKYNSEGKLTEYIVVRNPVEEVGEYVNYHWDSGDYFPVAFVNPLEAKANAYDLLMCRAGYREEPNYRKADRELERVVSYKDMETIARTAIDLVAQEEYDSGVSGLTDEHKEELADNLGINTEEAKKYFGLYIEMYEKREVIIRYTKECEYKTSIYVPVGTDDDEIENYFDNKVDFEELYYESETEDTEYTITKRNFQEYTLDEAVDECQCNGDYILDNSQF